MDDENLTTGKTQSISIESTEKSQTFTEACANMKQTNATEAQRIIAGKEMMGKPQPLTAACVDMKDTNAIEAQRIIADLETSGKILVGQDKSIDNKSPDTHNSEI